MLIEALEVVKLINYDSISVGESEQAVVEIMNSGK